MCDLNIGEGLVVVPKTCQMNREPSKGAGIPHPSPYMALHMEDEGEER